MGCKKNDRLDLWIYLDGSRRRPRQMRRLCSRRVGNPTICQSAEVYSAMGNGMYYQTTRWLSPTERPMFARYILSTRPLRSTTILKANPEALIDTYRIASSPQHISQPTTKSYYHSSPHPSPPPSHPHSYSSPSLPQHPQQTALSPSSDPPQSPDRTGTAA